jgi:hypothetical protein
MSEPGCNTLEPRIVGVQAEGLRDRLVALVGAHGHRVLTAEGVPAALAEGPSAVGLWLVELDRARDVPLPSGAPVVVVTSRRLRAAEVEALRAAGAHRVFDGEAALLEVSFACSELLFGSIAAHRRYDRLHGGLRVSFGAVEPGLEHLFEGRLLGLNRTGAQLESDAPMPAPGTLLRLTLRLEDERIAVLCRVACSARADGLSGSFVEFALDAPELSPRLASLTTTAPQPRAPSRATLRSPSVAGSTASASA